jgi:hypothetical protein
MLNARESPGILGTSRPAVFAAGLHHSGEAELPWLISAAGFKSASCALRQSPVTQGRTRRAPRIERGALKRARYCKRPVRCTRIADVFADPDADRLRRDVVLLLATSRPQRTPRQLAGSGASSCHHPLEAQRHRSIINAQSVHAEGRTPYSGQSSVPIDRILWL